MTAIAIIKMLECLNLLIDYFCRTYFFKLLLVFHENIVCIKIFIFFFVLCNSYIFLFKILNARAHSMIIFVLSNAVLFFILYFDGLPFECKRGNRNSSMLQKSESVFQKNNFFRFYFIEHFIREILKHGSL